MCVMCRSIHLFAFCTFSGPRSTRVSYRVLPIIRDGGYKCSTPTMTLIEGLGVACEEFVYIS